MISHRSLQCVVIGLAYAITIVSAGRSLSLSLSGLEYIDSVEDFRVTATLRNTGGETVKILNDPNSALSDIPTDIFTIFSDVGSSPAFTGVKAKYVATMAIATQDYTALKPGQSLEIEHNLALRYDLSSSGAGVYTIHPRNLFHVIDSSNPENAVEVYADHVPHIARISEIGVIGLGDQIFFNVTETDYDVEEDEDEVTDIDNKMGPSFRGCSARQKNLIRTAARQAQTYVSRAYGFLRSHRRYNRRYNTWFGSFNSNRYNTVLRAFRTINGNSYSRYTYDCSTCHKKPSTYAYVYPDRFGTVYLCGAFWRAPLVGTDSKAGTIVHESSHFKRNGGTDDHAYGHSKCKNLARTRPGTAIHNADSYEYFTENTA